jgi:hypothetical protein
MKILFLCPDAARKEFEFLEEASSPAALIEFFNSFDWEKGNKIIHEKKVLELPFFPQTLRFQRSETDFVAISPKKPGEYYLSCTNGKLVFETVVTRDVDRQKFSIEEFLHDFWSKNLVEKYNFEELDNSEIPDLYAESRFGFKTIWPFLFLLIAPGIVLIGDRRMSSHTNIQFLLLMTSVFVVLLLPYVLLLFQYLKYNKSTTLSINKKNRSVTITKSGQPKTFLFSDITKARIRRNDSRRYFTMGWGYLMLDLGDKERVVITTFLYKNLDSLTALLGVNPVFDNSMLPGIQLRIKSDTRLANDKNDFDLKVQEFTQKWNDKSDEELLVIKSNPSQYADYAVEAATRLLKR